MPFPCASASKKTSHDKLIAVWDAMDAACYLSNVELA